MPYSHFPALQEFKTICTPLWVMNIFQFTNRFPGTKHRQPLATLRIPFLNSFLVQEFASGREVENYSSIPRGSFLLAVTHLWKGAELIIQHLKRTQKGQALREFEQFFYGITDNSTLNFDILSHTPAARIYTYIL